MPGNALAPQRPPKPANAPATAKALVPVARIKTAAAPAPAKTPRPDTASAGCGDVDIRPALKPPIGAKAQFVPPPPPPASAAAKATVGNGNGKAGDAEVLDQAGPSVDKWPSTVDEAAGSERPPWHGDSPEGGSWGWHWDDGNSRRSSSSTDGWWSDSWRQPPDRSRSPARSLAVDRPEGPEVFFGYLLEDPFNVDKGAFRAPGLDTNCCWHLQSEGEAERIREASGELSRQLTDNHWVSVL